MVDLRQVYKESPIFITSPRDSFYYSSRYITFDTTLEIYSTGSLKLNRSYTTLAIL